MTTVSPFQVTMEPLEILVHLVPEETRDKMAYQDLLEKKEPWEVKGLRLPLVLKDLT